MNLETTIRHTHAQLTQLLDGIQPTLQALHNAQPGYPATTTGATPPTARTPTETPNTTTNPDNEGPLHLTPVERQALNHDPTQHDYRTATLMARQAKAATDRLHDILTRYQQHNTPRTTTPDQTPEGWCTSCYRNNQEHTPITLRTNTNTPYHTNLCRWCGDFKTIHKQLPPLPVLRQRHQGKRITNNLIQQHLTKRKKNRR